MTAPDYPGYWGYSAMMGLVGVGGGANKLDARPSNLIPFDLRGSVVATPFAHSSICITKHASGDEHSSRKQGFPILGAIYLQMLDKRGLSRPTSCQREG